MTRSTWRGYFARAGKAPSSSFAPSTYSSWSSGGQSRNSAMAHQLAHDSTPPGISERKSPMARQSTYWHLIDCARILLDVFLLYQPCSQYRVRHLNKHDHQGQRTCRFRSGRRRAPVRFLDHCPTVQMTDRPHTDDISLYHALRV